MRKVRIAAAVVAVVAVVALVRAAVNGWGIQPSGAVSAGPALHAAARPGKLTLFLLKQGTLVPVQRPALPGFPLLAIPQLGVPLTEQESGQGLTTAVPTMGLWAATNSTETQTFLDITPARKVTWSRLARAQIACTAEQLGEEAGTPRLTNSPDADSPGYLPLSCDDYADLR